MGVEWNLHHLEVFLTVARHGSFSRASEAMNISQPAVSMRVKQFEEALGLSLFDRMGKRVRLTSAGQEMRDYAQKLFGLLGEMDLVVEELKGMRRGSLQVAADTTAGAYVVPRLLGQFHRLYPTIRIAMSVGNRRTVLEKLMAGDVDLAVMGQVPDDPSLAADPFLRNELVVVASPRHRLQGLSAVPLTELLNEPFLVREQGSGTRASLERYLAEKGLTIRSAMELGSNDAIKQAVAADLGIAVLSRQAVALELSVGRLTVLDVEGFPIVRYWHAARLRERRLSAAGRAFYDFLLQSRMLERGTDRPPNMLPE